MRDDLTLEGFMAWVRARSSGQEEYQQAVQEVVETLLPVVNGDASLRRYRVLHRLAEPERIITFRTVWQADDGEIQINRGYRVQHSGLIGPYKGGIRFHPSVNESVLKFLAFEQTFKNALTGLPLGGGKGGSDFDPSGRSDAEIMRFCQAFMTELHRHIGAHTDVPAGDINVGAREIGFLFGQYRKIMNRFDGAMTGKSVAFGGSPCRVEATGYGLVLFVREMLKKRNEDLDGKTVVVSGAGNVATHAAEKAEALGAKVIALSDTGGTLEMADGLSAEQIDWVREHKSDGGDLEAFTKEHGGTWHADEKPWSLACDVALPCATQNELDADHAKTLIQNGCGLVAEGANMPCTSEAVTCLREAGVLYGPGKASNAGGVAVSGLEMGQNASFEHATAEEMGAELEKIMVRIHEQCVEFSDSDDPVDYAVGANRAAFQKLADATIAFGVN